MRKPSQRPGFRGAAIAGVITAIVLGLVGMSPSTAAADPPDNADNNCESALQGAPDAQLVLTTDPAAGPLAVGDDVEVTLTWGADVWTSIDKLFICMVVDDVLDVGSIYSEGPNPAPADDGTASSTFTVPAGADEVCFHGRVSGTPDQGNLTDSTHKTGQTCFVVGGDTPEDVCDEVDGVQTDPADCEEGALPSNETPKDPAEPAGTEVKGAVTLPVTGTATVPMAALAAGLIALGSVLVARSRKTIG